MTAQGGLLPFGDYPVYSADASALIDFRQLYPEAVLPSMWEFIRGLAAAARLVVADAVADECHDAELCALIDACPGMVVEFGAYEAHFAALMAEAQVLDLLLIDPADPNRSEGDPHVIALALMLAQRDPADMRTPTTPEARCVVVTHERHRNPGARLARIPDVCEHYALPHSRWLEFLIAERFRA